MRTSLGTSSTQVPTISSISRSTVFSACSALDSRASAVAPVMRICQTAHDSHDAQVCKPLLNKGSTGSCSLYVRVVCIHRTMKSKL